MEYNWDKILDFIQENLPYPDRKVLEGYLNEHERFKTMDYAIDTNSSLVAFCRWNVLDDGKVAHILDFVIKKEYRSRGVGRDFVLRMLNKFPNIEHIRFQRGARGSEESKHQWRELDIRGILKRSIF